MKTPLRFPTLLAALALSASPAAHAQITVGNVRPAQRPGTKLVDIDYDLTGIATPVRVWLEISADGGANWAVPATTVTGAVGANVSPATNLRIIWDAGADWNGQSSAQTRFRIKASDLQADLVELAQVPGGTFVMGANASSEQHAVDVSAFYVGRKEVTKTQWDEVRLWGLLHGYSDISVGDGMASQHPVQQVSWYDVAKWCNAKSEKEGLTPCYYTTAAQAPGEIYKTGNLDLDNTMVKWSANGYRLPTEAEWEKAARGGLIGKVYPWGDTISHNEANFYFYPGGPGFHPDYSTFPYTAPTGSFAANGYGLFDVAGNVSEWCWDWYDGYSTSPASDPRGPGSNPSLLSRINRGGNTDATYGVTEYVTCSRRNAYGPLHKTYYLGFRVARGL